MHINNIDVHSRERENKRRKISQKNRMTGKVYEGLKKNKITKKLEYVLKQPRAIGDRERVCGKKCKAESTVAACPQITDEQRAQLFDSYWKMNWDQRRIYIASMVTNYPPKRRRQGQQQSHRSVTFRYHFKLSGVLIPVCKNFFLSTLDMKEWSVKEWSRTASATNNNNNCLKSNIQCIEIRVQWTVHLGSSHMHVHAVTRVHAVTPKLVTCVMYLTSI